jgi:hypothetical protein
MRRERESRTDTQRDRGGAELDKRRGGSGGKTHTFKCDYGGRARQLLCVGRCCGRERRRGARARASVHAKFCQCRAYASGVKILGGGAHVQCLCATAELRADRDDDGHKRGGAEGAEGRSARGVNQSRGLPPMCFFQNPCARCTKQQSYILCARARERERAKKVSKEERERAGQ